MYANELVSIKNSDNIIQWEYEAIKHLEGSEHMESIMMKFKVDRSENNETIKFLIPDLENSSVNITDSNM